MSLFHLPLDQIEQSDLAALIENKVRESRTIEYKEKLPSSSDENDKFCFTVCSFANTSGGDVVFGVRERRDGDAPSGEPEQIVPINTNLESERLRLLQLIKSYIEPRLSGCRIKAVEVSGGYVCVLRIPKSWIGLHAVRKNEFYRFYHRTSAGRSTMDMSEIRAALVSAEGGYERLRRFRIDRLDRITRNEGPVDIDSGPATIVHIIPFSSLDPTIQFDLQTIERDHDVSPILTGSYSHRYTFDGLVKYSVSQPAPSYVQIFRDGTIEACLVDLFDSEKRTLAVSGIEDLLIRSLPGYLTVLKRLGVSGPLFIGLILTGIHNFSAVPGKWVHTPVNPFREKRLVVPEILVDSEEAPIHVMLRPAFDRIWNAAGLPGSPSYDQDGNWNPKRSMF